eukprot:5498568-Pyramimonas_sp.AAC.1
MASETARRAPPGLHVLCAAARCHSTGRPKCDVGRAAEMTAAPARPDARRPLGPPARLAALRSQRKQA